MKIYKQKENINKNMEYKKILKYVLPSVLAFALSGVYGIVDGYFVGNRVGDAGITAINLVYPVVALLQALGTGIGMGGAVQYSIKKASGRQEEAAGYVNSTITLLLFASIGAMAVFLPIIHPLMGLLGATGIIGEYGSIYLNIVMAGAICQIFGTGITPLVRNNGGAVFSMVVMIAGFFTNITLDFLLVWILDKGIKGAAIATVAGQLVTALGGIGYLIWKKLPVWRLRIHGRSYFYIVKIGISAFGVTLCPNISLLLMNLFLMKYGGASAVACYAVISYASYIVYLMLQGVGDGFQPLLSDCYGRGDHKGMKKMQNASYAISEFIAVTSFLLLFSTRSYIGKLFGASDLVCQLVVRDMPIILIGFLFLALARVITSGFYATEKSGKSVVLVYSETVFLLVLLLIFPGRFGETAVWWSMSGAQMLAMVLALILKQVKQ